MARDIFAAGRTNPTAKDWSQLNALKKRPFSSLPMTAVPMTPENFTAPKASNNLQDRRHYA